MPSSQTFNLSETGGHDRPRRKYTAEVLRYRMKYTANTAHRSAQHLHCRPTAFLPDTKSFKQRLIWTKQLPFFCPQASYYWQTSWSCFGQSSFSLDTMWPRWSQNLHKTAHLRSHYSTRRHQKQTKKENKCEMKEFCINSHLLHSKTRDNFFLLCINLTKRRAAFVCCRKIAAEK